MKIEVLGTTPSPQQMITWVARFSHRSHDKASPEADAKLFKALYERGHWSTFEFNRWTVLVRFEDGLLEWLAETHGWELTDIGDEKIISGNARTLLDGISTPFGHALLKAVAREQGWRWLQDCSWWEYPLEQLCWNDYYIYEPILEILPPTERAKHAAALFVFRDISRVCATQMLRHRLCSFMQESLRYVGIPKRFYKGPYVVPRTIRQNPRGLVKLYRSACDAAFGLYHDFIGDWKVPKEDARFVLPLSTKTTLVVMASLREWAHIIKLRTPKAAQWEIREKMGWMRDVLLERVPWFEEVL